MVHRRLFLAVAVLLAGGLAAWAAHHRSPVRAVPRRAAAVAPRFAPRAVPRAVRRARRRATAALGHGGVLQVDPATGGVRSLARLNGLLTGPHAGDPRRVVLRYVRANRRVFGLTAADLRGLRRGETVRDGGLTHLHWRQTVRGVPLLDGDLRATVTRDGRIVSVGGGAAPGLAAAVGGVRPRVARPAGAELVITTATGAPRLAWHVVRHRAGGAVVDETIDARTGRELRRFDRAVGVKARYFPAWPGAPVGGQPTDIDLGAWLDPGLGALTGPRAHVFADLDDNESAGPGEEVAPVLGDYLYDRKPYWLSGCPAAGCAWDPATPGSWRANVKQAATNVFVQLHEYADYLAQPPISFSDFHDADKVVARVMVGAAGPNDLPDPSELDNTSMYTPPPGRGPEMEVSLFKDVSLPPTDSADDASVIWHEYTHGLNARSVINGTGWSALATAQAGALDEGLADFFSLDRMVELGLMTDGPREGDVMVGRGIDPNRVLRTEGADCPVDSQALDCVHSDLVVKGGYTYGDFGHVHWSHHSEPHADGEIITQTLWQLRQRLVAERGQAAALPLLRQLIVQALRSVPPEPSFLDLRNAMLEADRALHDGGTSADIWAVFAERGMGYSASTREGDDIDPVERFDLPPAFAESTLSGTVRDRATGEPIAGAQVALGGHDTIDPSPDYLHATTDADGRYRIAHVPTGTYPQLLVHASRYEDGVAGDVAVAPAGGTADVALRRNWADGAKVTGVTGPDYTQFHCGPGQAVDGDHTTSWLTTRPSPSDPAQRSVTIELPQALRVTSFGVDPTPRAHFYECPAANGAMSGPWPTAVHIQVSRSLRNPDWETAADLTVTPSLIHRVTELHPAAPLEGVRRVRVLLDGPARGAWLHFAELQVFASPQLPPRAALAATPAAPDVQEPITLDASGSRPRGEAAISRYQWDLDGDGVYERDTRGVPTTAVTFDAAGVHAIGVKVTDDAGESDEARRTVVVGTGAEINDLGTLQDHDAGMSRAFSIASNGTIVGTSELANGATPGYWMRSGQMEQLPLPDGIGDSVAYDVNAAGQVIGAMSATDATQRRPVMWDDGAAPVDLGDLGGGAAAWGDAIGINASGWVAGWSEDAKSLQAPFLKPPRSPMIDVQEAAGVPANQRTSGALKKLSDNGVAVGCLGSDDLRRGPSCDWPIRYDALSRTLTRLPVLVHYGGADDQNDAGTAVGGVYDIDNTELPAAWAPDGTLRLLPTIGRGGEAISINGAGEMVGQTTDVAGGHRAARWRDGKVEDLNRYVNGTGWTLTDAYGIDDRDEVVGEGRIDGHWHAFELLLGPCRVCVEDVKFQQQDVRTGHWVDAGDDGVVDGNRVDAVVTVHNRDTVTHLFQLAAHDDTRGEDVTDSAPAVELDPGDATEVRIPVATEGRAFDAAQQPQSDHVLRFRAKIGHRTFSSRAAVLKVRPRPIIAVPDVLEGPESFAGYRDLAAGYDRDWQVFAVGDGQAPGVLETGSWSNLEAAPKTIAENAVVLDHYIEGVREATEAAHVDLVAHGMGGLIARQWIADVMAPGEAAHLVELGVPNAGTACAELPDADAFTELRRDAVAAFNARVTERRGVAFSALAGTAGTTSGCATTDGEANDAVVPVSSATDGVDDTKTMDLIHAQLPRDGLVFSTFVRPHLTGAPPAGSASLRAAAAPPDDGAAPRTQQLLGQRTVSLPAGGDGAATFDLDGGGRLDVHVTAAPDVTAQLVAPDGTVAAALPAGTGAFRTLSADGPDAGRWTLRLHNAGGDPVQALATAQVADDPWQLDVQLGGAPAGSPLPVAATVARDGARVRGAQVTVAFRRRGGATDHATLYDDGAHGDGAAGDGCYAGGTAVAAGDAVVTVDARSGTSERLARTLARVAPGDARSPACAPGFGRPGEIAYAQRGGTWRTTTGALDGVPRTAQDASYSPDGTKLAWSLGDSVYVAGASGDGARRVAGGDDVSREGVAWSPDGTRLAYAVHCHDGCAIAVLDLASGAEHELVADGDQPTWAPAGDRLAFRRLDADADQAWCAQDTGFCPPAYDLWVVGADGSGPRQLTRGGHGDSDPAWSPAGDRSAFTRWVEYGAEEVRLNNAEIYTVAPDGTGLAALTDDPTCTAETSSECKMDDDDEQPAWSPDGRQIVYSSTRGEPWQSEGEGPETSQLWVMRRDGSGAHPVTSGDYYKEAPSWRALPYLTTAAPPECHDVTARTTAGVAVRVTLDCADPNGDVLEERVLDGPAHGSLGPVGADGTVRYTPAAGYTGDDAFTFTASDGSADATPATVHLTVTAPPPPAPTPTPAPSGGPVYTGGSGGSSSPGSPQPGGGPIVVPIHGIPGDCVILPDGSCFVGVPCEVIGPNDCVGRALQAPGGAGPARVAVAARVRALLRPTSVRIKRGHTGRVRLTLSAYGRSQLRRRGRLAIRVRIELRAGARLVGASTRTVRFRRRG